MGVLIGTGYALQVYYKVQPGYAHKGYCKVQGTHIRGTTRSMVRTSGVLQGTGNTHHGILQGTGYAQQGYYKVKGYCIRGNTSYKVRTLWVLIGTGYGLQVYYKGQPGYAHKGY